MRLGPYEVQKLLGRGATACVYECRHRRLERRFAVKVLHEHLARQEVARARFLREARALSRIAHPNVVEVFDVDEHDGTPYMVMALVAGEDLGAIVRRLHPVPIAILMDCLIQVVAAVQAAHDAGIVHRDLKPSNIRVLLQDDAPPQVKVLDFGVSKVRAEEASTDITNTDGILGTTEYMAPEQLRSAKKVDARSDVYALGVVLYRCATNAHPFRGDNPYEVMHAIMTAPVAPPSSLRSDLPPELDAIVLRAMQRDPSARFSSAAEMGRALAAFATTPASWEATFATGAHAGRDEHEATGAIVGADPGTRSLTMASPPPRRAGGQARRATVGLAAAIALAAATVTIGVRGGTGRTEVVRPLVAPDLGATAPPSAPLPSVPTESLASPVKADAPPSSSPMASVGHVVSERRTTTRRTTSPAPASTPSLSRGPAIALSDPAAQRQELGTNGAPILE